MLSMNGRKCHLLNVSLRHLELLLHVFLQHCFLSNNKQFGISGKNAEFVHRERCPILKVLSTNVNAFLLTLCLLELLCLSHTVCMLLMNNL
jgi:hypothetical protein